MRKPKISTRVMGSSPGAMGFLIGFDAGHVGGVQRVKQDSVF